MSVAQEGRPDQIDFTIGHFRQRIQEMTPLLLQTTAAAMRLGKDDAVTPQSEAFYAVRIEACEAEFLARGISEPVVVAPPGCGAGWNAVSPETQRMWARRVRELRQQGWTYEHIRDEVGISMSTIERILNRRGVYATLEEQA